MKWRSKNSYPKPIEGLNAVMTSLLVKDGHVYGIAGIGELICQKLDTGEVVRNGTEIFGEKAVRRALPKSDGGPTQARAASSPTVNR